MPTTFLSSLLRKEGSSEVIINVTTWISLGTGTNSYNVKEIVQFHADNITVIIVKEESSELIINVMLGTPLEEEIAHFHDNNNVIIVKKRRVVRGDH